MSKPKKPPQLNYLLPPEECERVYEVLGGHPGLDPCGHVDQFLKAEKVMYGMDSEDDGFMAPWADYGTVLLNAPHGEREPDWEGIESANPDWHRPDWPWYPFSKWIAKGSAEAQRGATVLAFMPAATDRGWFHDYGPEMNSMALLRQRVKCWIPLPGGEPIRGPQPQNAHMLVLWTPEATIADRFYEVYRGRGMIVEPKAVTA